MLIWRPWTCSLCRMVPSSLRNAASAKAQTTNAADGCGNAASGHSTNLVKL